MLGLPLLDVSTRRESLVSDLCAESVAAAFGVELSQWQLDFLDRVLFEGVDGE